MRLQESHSTLNIITMQHSFLKYFWIGVFVFSCHAISAQQDSLLFPKLSFNIDNLNFNKNNEYFNNIADGYTLIGSQLHPKLAYQPHPGFQLELGVFALYYGGTEKYHKVIPTFSLDYKLGGLKMTVGTLHNKTLHNLIAPLMTSEALLDERSLESGSQIRYFSDKFNLDFWLNWETFIFKGDSRNEDFVQGLSMDYRLIKNEKWQLKIPIQNLFYHNGGQINTDLVVNRKTYTMWHLGVGIDLKRTISENQSLGLNSYFINYQSTPNPNQYIFDKGTGFLSEINYQYSYFKLGLGYWRGDQFVSARGDDMFQSVSNKTDIHYENGVLQPFYQGHTEPKRTLFFSKLTYQRELFPDLYVTTEVNLFYQNYASNVTDIPSNELNGVLDYNYSVKVRYSGNIRLKN